MRAMLPRCRSPWHSRTKPCSRRRRKASRREACSRSVHARRRLDLAALRLPSPATGRSAEKFRCARCRIPSGVPNALAAAATSIAAVKGGHLGRERVDIGGPELAAVEQPLARASWGNSRIFTAYSTAGPVPPITGASTLPVIGTTSR